MKQSILQLPFIIICFILLIMPSPKGYCQASQNQLSMQDIPVTWNDFSRKKIRNDHAFTAKTKVNYNGHYRFDQISSDSGLLRIDFDVEMDKKSSYVSKDFLKEADSAQRVLLLNHERGHWIISMIYFQKLDSTLRAFPFSKRIRSELASINHNNHSQLIKMQSQYDRETNHSKNAAEQKEWEKKLLTQLFDAYGRMPEFPKEITIKRTVVKGAS